jgi:hypothetical protein
MEERNADIALTKIIDKIKDTKPKFLKSNCDD